MENRKFKSSPTTICSSSPAVYRSTGQWASQPARHEQQRGKPPHESKTDGDVDGPFARAALHCSISSSCTRPTKRKQQSSFITINIFVTEKIPQTQHLPPSHTAPPPPISTSLIPYVSTHTPAIPHPHPAFSSRPPSPRPDDDPPSDLRATKAKPD